MFRTVGSLLGRCGPCGGPCCCSVGPAARWFRLLGGSCLRGEGAPLRGGGGSLQPAPASLHHSSPQKVLQNARKEGVHRRLRKLVTPACVSDKFNIKARVFCLYKTIALI